MGQYSSKASMSSSLTRALRPALRGGSRCLVQKAVRNGVARPISGANMARPLSTTRSLRNDTPIDITEIPPTPITHLSETESAMQEMVSKFASEVILPKARDMDEAETMDPAVVEQLFEQGLMGIEIPEEYGGAGMNFSSAIVGIEELARADPSVSVMVDVHNTLVNTAVLKYGSEHIKKKWLPKPPRPLMASPSPAVRCGSPTPWKPISSSSSPTSTPRRATRASPPSLLKRAPPVSRLPRRRRSSASRPPAPVSSPSTTSRSPRRTSSAR